MIFPFFPGELRAKSRTLCLLGKCSTTELNPQLLEIFSEKQVVHSGMCLDPTTWETKARRSQVHCPTGYIARSCLKIQKYNKQLRYHVQENEVEGHHLTAGAQKQPMQQSTPWPQIYKQINLMQFHPQSHKAGLTLPLLAGLTVP